MRNFREQPSGVIVDLDNPETYKHLPKTVKALDNLMFREIGMAICYIDYWHPDVFEKEKREPDMSRGWTEEEIKNGWPDAVVNSGYNQRIRVYELIKDFTTNRRHNYENVLWYQEQIFKFQNETENMC